MSKKLKIVNGDSSSGQKAYLNIVRHCEINKVITTGREEAAFNGGFTEFINGGLDEWLAA